MNETTLKKMGRSLEALEKKEKKAQFARLRQQENKIPPREIPPEERTSLQKIANRIPALEKEGNRRKGTWSTGEK